MVVPIFAPRMTPMACIRFMMAELTNPTTMTVVTELDWTRQVTSRPVRTPMTRLFVIALIIFRRRSPAMA